MRVPIGGQAFSGSAEIFDRRRGEPALRVLWPISRSRPPAPLRTGKNAQPSSLTSRARGHSSCPFPMPPYPQSCLAVLLPGPARNLALPCRAGRRRASCMYISESARAYAAARMQSSSRVRAPAQLSFSPRSQPFSRVRTIAPRPVCVASAVPRPLSQAAASASPPCPCPHFTSAQLRRGICTHACASPSGDLGLRREGTPVPSVHTRRRQRRRRYSMLHPPRPPRITPRDGRLRAHPDRAIVSQAGAGRAMLCRAYVHARSYAHGDGTSPTASRVLARSPLARCAFGVAPSEVGAGAARFEDAPLDAGSQKDGGGARGRQGQANWLFGAAKPRSAPPRRASLGCPPALAWRAPRRTGTPSRAIGARLRFGEALGCSHGHRGGVRTAIARVLAHA